MLITCNIWVCIWYTIVMNYEQQVKRWKQFVLLREKGLSWRQIGNKYNITRGAVQQRVKKGIPLASTPRNEKWKNLGLLSKEIKGRRRTRLSVLIRDNFTCVDCGDVRTYEEVLSHNTKIIGLKGKMKLHDVHHINGLCGKKSIGYDSIKDLSGLITLCHKCHFNRHDHYYGDSYIPKANRG